MKRAHHRGRNKNFPKIQKLKKGDLKISFEKRFSGFKGCWRLSSLLLITAPLSFICFLLSLYLAFSICFRTTSYSPQFTYSNLFDLDPEYVVWFIDFWVHLICLPVLHEFSRIQLTIPSSFIVHAVNLKSVWNMNKSGSGSDEAVILTPWVMNCFGKHLCYSHGFFYMSLAILKVHIAVKACSL